MIAEHLRSETDAPGGRLHLDDVRQADDEGTFGAGRTEGVDRHRQGDGEVAHRLVAGRFRPAPSARPDSTPPAHPADAADNDGI